MILSSSRKERYCHVNWPYVPTYHFTALNDQRLNEYTFLQVKWKPGYLIAIA